MNKPLIIILGPTASGKTAMSLELAKKFKGEIISADSRQIYKEMNIMTAKEPSESIDGVYNINGIPHFGIDVVKPDDDYTLADWLPYARQKIDEIHERGSIPILVGSNPLYISAVADGYILANEEQNPARREELSNMTLDDLILILKKLNPTKLTGLDTHNPIRIIRAIEMEETNSPGPDRETPPYKILMLGIEINREKLYDRINKRVDQMITNGGLEEAKSLYEKYGTDHVSMSGIGYQQLNEYFQDKISLNEAIDNIKQASRNYAKRQLTWWRKDERINWINSIKDAKLKISKFL